MLAGSGPPERPTLPFTTRQPAPAAANTMSAFHEERVLTVHHWTDRQFSFTTTRDPALRFLNGHFTMIANAVTVDAPGIVRRPACELRDDSDLGERLVTVQVPVLSAEQRAAALRAGAGRARRCCDDGLIAAAALVCQGECIQVGALVLSQRTVIASDHLALA